MPVSQLSCPGCGAPAPSTSGACVYCGANLQVTGPGAQAPHGTPTSGPPVAEGATFDVLLRGLRPAHVGVLVEILGRPAARMAEVPTRTPPVVFGVPAAKAQALGARLAPDGVVVELLPPRPGGPRGPNGHGPGGPRGPGWR